MEFMAKLVEMITELNCYINKLEIIVDEQTNDKKDIIGDERYTSGSRH